MTDCCSNPPSIGTWKIYLRLPIYYPPRIKWDWGNGVNQIEGTDYILNSKVPNARKVGLSFYYRIRYEDGGKSGLQQWYREVYTPYFFDIIPTQHYRLYGYDFNGNNGMRFESKVLSPNQYSDYGYIEYRLDNQLDKEWNLKIYNKGALVIDESRTQNNAPSVIIEPEKCLQTEQKEFVREYKNYKTKDYCYQQTQNNQAFLFVMIEQLNGNFAAGLLASSASDERCSIPPQYEVECIPCDQCPPNSCEYICDDTVCCYDLDNGNLVKSFAVSNLC